MQNDEEIWKCAHGGRGRYEVSNFGRVRSLDFILSVKNPFGIVAKRKFKGRVLKPGTHKNGYKLVSFTFPQEKRKYLWVHHLVAHSFLGPRPKGMFVCHFDDNPANNRIDNLRYASASDNWYDAVRNNKIKTAVGENSSGAKLTNEKVLAIRALQGSVSNRKIAAFFGITHGTVGLILAGKTWSHI